MREILFRGKCIETGKWITGYFAKTPDYTGESYKSTIWLEDDLGFGKEVDPETVGQFTGLLDKNGVKIFEGDVVQGFYPPEKCLERGYVVYSEDTTGYIVQQGESSSWDLFMTENIEVIGNGHDNPELMQEVNRD